MKKIITCALIALLGIAVNVNAQGYYLYKNGTRQTVLSNEMDSLVFFNEYDIELPSDEYDPENATAAKAATTHTEDQNKAWYDKLDFENLTELENAKRGCIEATPDLVIYNDAGQEVWNMQMFKFLLNGGAAPATVNPSLWQNALCNVQAGLFEVLPDKIYQVRGFDMANMTFIKTEHGWMIFDVLMGSEVARAALDLFKRNIDANPTIVAVLVSHSHADHFGGMTEVLKNCTRSDSSLPLEQQINPGKTTAVIVPEGFMHHVVSENVYAGPAMKRRAGYQYGANIPKGTTGRMAMGIGMGQAVNGTASVATPTFEVSKTETYNIDGITVTFQVTPGTEAPAEMNAYFKEYHALWMAENCTGTLHNLYTLRGAEVRNAEDWCKYILEAEQMFGSEAEVVFQSHNWPHWGNQIVKEYLENTAAIYKFTHDQTLHYMNLGYTSTEISNMLELPEKLAKVWYTRQYYGTLSHNIKAVYQKYLGWYDANPVNLNLLPPAETAKKLVEYLGDPERIIRMAREDYAKGEYQWVAQITKELVYADPSNMEARRLCADALEQLGYQSESGTWRNAYLTGAMELRAGTPAPVTFAGDPFLRTLAAASLEMCFEFAAIKNDSRLYEDFDVTVNFIIDQEKCCVARRNGVVLIYNNETRPNADATATGTKLALLAGFNGDTSGLNITGNQDAVISLMPSDMVFPLNYNVIEP